MDPIGRGWALFSSDLPRTPHSIMEVVAACEELSDRHSFCYGVRALLVSPLKMTSAGKGRRKIEVQQLALLVRSDSGRRDA